MRTAELVRLPLRAMRRAAISWSVTLALIIVATVAFWPAFKGTALEDVLNQLPSGMIEALGLQDFGSPAGYLRGNLYELLVPLLAAAAGVLLANGATASDEDAGRMELVLTQPVTRHAVFSGRVLAVVVTLIVIAIAVLISQLASDAIFDLPIDAVLLVNTIGLCFALGGLHAALAFAIAGLTARPGLVLAVGLGTAIFGYLVSALFPLSDALAGLAKLSPWNWALAGDPLVNAMEPWRYLALVIPSVLLVMVGLWGFARRDVNAA